MSAEPRRRPWVEILLALPLLGVVGYGLKDPHFPWSAILFFWWIPGAAVGIVAARTRGFRPLIGALAGMLICFPLCLLLFLVDPRKPASGDAPSREAEPSRGLAKAAAFFGVSGFACWGLCGVMPALGLLLGLVALVLSARSPEKYGGRALAATGIVTSGFVGWLVLTGPIPQPTPDMLRWRLRTDAERAVAQALRTNVGRAVAVDGRPAAPPEEMQRVRGWEFSFHAGWEGSFAFIALPIERRWWKRLDEEWWRPARAFCADDSGRVCHVQGGPDPVPEHGRCPPPDRCLD